MSRMTVPIRSLLRHCGGNTAVIFAAVMVPLFFLTGMGIDYTFAVMRNDQLAAMSDSAALAAVTPAMISQSDQASITAAKNAFNAQAGSVLGVNYDPTNLHVSVADVSSGNTVKRTVSVNYIAQSQDSFLNLFWGPTIGLGGTSQATATTAPNINFYLLLDSSPSMLIAATPTGITNMESYTSAQTGDGGPGCAFACHETHPTGDDNTGNPNGEDNYALARAKGVTLRIDLLQQATQNLMTTAQTTENTDGAQYGMAIYTFDIAFNTIQQLTQTLSFAASAAANIQALEVYSNNNLISGNSSTYNNDEDTNYDNAMTNINSTMPNPGLGTDAPNDTPQEVMFFVTDGEEDENVSGSRQESVMDPGWCTTIKNRGIRIAVLYTTYVPITISNWYNGHVASYQSSIATSLQSCASPQLYFEVQSGGDISAAMTTLFQTAVATAHLSQ